MNPAARKLQIVLVCGAKNAGKTQYLKEIHNRARKRGLKVGGFLSLAQTENGLKTHYFVHLLHMGEQRLLARYSAKPSHLKIGRYVFEPRTFEWAEHIVKQQLGLPVLILDEFGPLEMEGKGWYALLLFLLRHYKGLLFISVRPTLLRPLLELIRNER